MLAGGVAYRQVGPMSSISRAPVWRDPQPLFTTLLQAGVPAKQVPAKQVASKAVVPAKQVASRSQKRSLRLTRQCTRKDHCTRPAVSGFNTVGAVGAHSAGVCHTPYGVSLGVRPLPLPMRLPLPETRPAGA